MEYLFLFQLNQILTSPRSSHNKRGFLGFTKASVSLSFELDGSYWAFNEVVWLTFGRKFSSWNNEWGEWRETVALSWLNKPAMFWLQRQQRRRWRRWKSWKINQMTIFIFIFTFYFYLNSPTMSPSPGNVIGREILLFFVLGVSPHPRQFVFLGGGW